MLVACLMHLQFKFISVLNNFRAFCHLAGQQYQGDLTNRLLLIACAMAISFGVGDATAIIQQQRRTGAVPKAATTTL